MRTQSPAAIEAVCSLPDSRTQDMNRSAAGERDSHTSTSGPKSTSETPILTSDLDVVNSGAAGREKADAQTWHVLAICADARGNIESEILQRLASVRPRFQLIGLTYALLHGTAVIFLLIHEPQPDDPPGPPVGPIPQQEKEETLALQADLCATPTLSKVQVLLHERLSTGTSLAGSPATPCCESVSAGRISRRHF